jgi:hypothetical protein
MPTMRPFPIPMPPRPAELRLLLLLLLIALPFATPANDAVLPAYSAEYEVIRNGKTLGSSRAALSRQGAQWRFATDTTGDRGMAALLGFRIDQHVDFRWHDGMPQPVASLYDQQATVGSRRVEVQYDWTANRYRLVDRKGEHAHPLVPGTIDRYGSGIFIAAKLASGAREFVLPVAYPDGVREWRFRSTGSERVQTPAGTVDALRVERVRDDDRTTVSWHDPARHFVAVRLVQTEDGDTTETRLRSFRITPAVAPQP